MAIRPLTGAEYHVSAAGTPSGNGSLETPWDLAAALAHPPQVRPGDTIWLHSGVYAGDFVSRLEGTPQEPITVRAAAGACVVIDGSLRIEGAGSVYWGLEIRDSGFPRRTESAGSQPRIAGGHDAVDVLAPHTALINNVIHDNAQGVGFWSPAHDSLLYGNLVFNNGWLGPVRRHGAGLYTQNRQGVKRIEHNVFANNFSKNIQAYGTKRAGLEGFEFRENVLVNGRMLVGGFAPAERVTAAGNHSYRGNLQFFYRNRENRGLRVEGNYVVGKLVIGPWRGFTVRGNTVAGGARGRLVTLRPPGNPDPAPGRPAAWNRNAYYFADPAARMFDVDGEGVFTLEGWRARTGFDEAVEQVRRPPSAPYAAVFPNRYEAGRAHVAVYNWSGEAAVSVDLSPLGLPPRARVRVYNAQNPAESLTDRLDNGTLRLPMAHWTAATPRGVAEPLHPSTFPRFGVFLVRSAARASRPGLRAGREPEDSCVLAP